MASIVFECEICREEYDSADRKPISLKCGHTFCRECLVRIETSRRSCPECEQPIEGSVDKLPVIYALIPPSKKTAVQKNHSPQVSRCQIHDIDLDLFCADCCVILCRKCFRQSHQQHRVEFKQDILNKDEVAAKFTQELLRKIETKVKATTINVSASSKISSTLDEMKVCKEKMQQHEDILLAIKTSAAEDLNSWNNTGSKSAEEEHELFKRLCEAWKERDEVLPHEETSNFLKMVDELIAGANRVQKLAEEVKKSMQQREASSNAGGECRAETSPDTRRAAVYIPRSRRPAPSRNGWDWRRMD